MPVSLLASLQIVQYSILAHAYFIDMTVYIYILTVIATLILGA